MSDFYATQSQIGERCNLSSHIIGRFLKKLNWRNPDGSPTQEAIDSKLCRQQFDEVRRCVFWVWNAAKVFAALEEAIQSPTAFAAAQRERAAAAKTAQQDDEGEWEPPPSK